MFSCVFTEERIEFGHNQHKSQIGGVLQWCLSFCRFLLSPDMRFLVTSLDKALLHQVLSLASSKKKPGRFKTSSIKGNRDHMLLWPFNAAEMFLNSSPDLWFQYNPVSTDNSLDFMDWLLLWHALLTVGPYTDRCVCLSKSCPINSVYHRWTPTKL